MTGTARRVLLAVAAAAALGGCASDDEIAEGPPVYHVTKERHGETVRLVPGQVLAAVLPTVAGAARWQAEVDDPTVVRRRTGSELIAPRVGNAVVGGARGHERIVFDALRPGSARVRLTRSRTAKEGGGTALFEVGVLVSAGAAHAR